jgi:predicted membrane protein
MLDGFWANVIGILGSILIVCAYAYNVYAKDVSAFIYNGANLAGAIFLTISLLVHFNLASFLLEMVWITIAVSGLWKAYRTQARKQS